MTTPAREPYRPSNGDAGEAFMNQWCYQCVQHDGPEGCDIQIRALIFSIDDEDYPTEWVTGKGGPVCTAFLDAEEYEFEEPSVIDDPRQKPLPF